MARIYINAFNLSQHTCNCSKARDESKCGALGSQDQVIGQRPKGCLLKHHRGHFGIRCYIRRDVQITLRRISECLEVVFIAYLDYYPVINYRSIQNSSKVGYKFTNKLFRTFLVRVPLTPIFSRTADSILICTRLKINPSALSALE